MILVALTLIRENCSDDNLQRPIALTGVGFRPGGIMYRQLLANLKLRNPQWWGGSPEKAYPVILETTSSNDTGIIVARNHLDQYVRSVDGSPSQAEALNYEPRMLHPEAPLPQGIPWVNIDGQNRAPTWIRHWLNQVGLQWADPIPEERLSLLKEYQQRRYSLRKNLAVEPVNYDQTALDIIEGRRTSIDGLGSPW